VSCALILFAVFKIVLNASRHYDFPLLGFLAVLAAALNALAVGAPFVPGLRIFSPLEAIRPHSEPFVNQIKCQAHCVGLTLILAIPYIVRICDHNA
jgi:hypothetical protein